MAQSDGSQQKKYSEAMIFAQQEIQKELSKKTREIQDYVFLQENNQRQHSKTPRAQAKTIDIELLDDKFGNPNDLYS